MSMIGNYLRLRPDELDELIANPQRVTGCLYPEDGEHPAGRDLDIDKTWNVIQFLLTGESVEPHTPLHDAVLGGSVLGTEDVGYGPARYLTPAEVQATAWALAEVPPEKLWTSYEERALLAADVYPGTWTSADEDRGYVVPYYEDLRRFFTAAAGAGDAILLYLN